MMVRGRLLKFLSMALSTVMLSMFAIPGIAADVSKTTKEELKSMLDNPDVVILDVRTGNSWKASEKKIKGTVREDPKDVESWAKKYPKDKTLVLY